MSSVGSNHKRIKGRTTFSTLMAWTKQKSSSGFIPSDHYHVLDLDV